MWYEGLNVNITNFKHLSRRFTSLVSELVDRKPFSVVIVADHSAPASVDLKTKTIFVDANFFNGSHAVYGTLSYKRRLEFCAGVVVHEGAHIAFTPPNAFDLMLPKGKVPRNNVTFAVANVVEDIFIESFAKLQNPNFAGIIDFVSNVLFNDEEIKNRRNAWNGEKPQTEEEIANAINYMICWKRRNFPFFHLTDFERKLYNLFMSANEEGDIKQRAKIVNNILKMLLLESSEEDEENNEEDEENNEEDGTGESSNCGIATIDGKQVELPENKGSYEKLKGNFSVVHSEGQKTDGFLAFKVKPANRQNQIKSVSYSGFEKMIEARNAQRALKGLPRESGKRIRNLQHFNEGKIFGEMFIDGGRVGRGKQEIVILLDLSGSMNGMSYFNGVPKKKIEFAIENVAGIAKALDKEGFDYAVIGHTEGSLPSEMRYLATESYGAVILYKIKEIKERKKYEMVNESLSWVLSNFSGGGNNDSCAILLASKEFSNANSEKILIVVSDGEPTERNPAMLNKAGVKPGNSSVEDTQSVVLHLRSAGISVFSLAIDESAIKPCEEIYGKKFSTSAFKPEEFVDAIIKFTE